MPVAETRYTKTADGVHIAYQVIGDGPIDLVWVMGWTTNLEALWEEPRLADFLRRVASFSRLILFDKRGMGLSDRVPEDRLPSLETRMDDVRAVMDAAGSDRAVVFGVSEGGPMACLFAATYPERTVALILYGTVVDYTCPSDRRLEHRVGRVPRVHRRALGHDRPRAGGDPRLGSPEPRRRRAARRVAGVVPPPRRQPGRRRRVGADEPRHQRVACPPGDPRADARAGEDGRPGLPRRAGPCDDRADRGRAPRGVPGRRALLLGRDLRRPAGVHRAVRRRAQRPGGRSSDRSLATVVFTDIVDSTATAASLGDARWKELLERAPRRVRGQLARFEGAEVDTAGDGFLATFDGPARAVRCATCDRGVDRRAGARGPRRRPHRARSSRSTARSAGWRW